MSQHDFNIANQTFPSFRSDLNDALQAAATMSAGASAPTTPYAYQLWFDTTTDTWKVRNSGNTAWVSTITTDLATGNLLVGHTVENTWPNNNSAILRSSGVATFTSTSTPPLYANRLTSDGDIVQFRINGGTVGSIGTGNTNRLFIGSGDAAIMFDATTNAIYPWNITAASPPASDQVDLGYDAAGLKFKNLYLGGGVYLGGTGSANLLDDYEEGTWTPTLPNGGTVSGLRASYTKIGRLVHVQFQADLTPTNNSSDFRIGGLPFITTSTTSSYSVGSLGYTGGLDVSGWQQPIVQHNGGDFFYFQLSTASVSSIANSAFAGSTRNFVMSASYETN